MKRLLVAAVLFLASVNSTVYGAEAATDTKGTAVSLAQEQQRTPIVYTSGKSEIDATYKDDGYLSIRYLKATSKKLKVKICKTDTVEYTYDLKNTAMPETYSFQSGNGKYLVKVLENLEGTKYAVVQSQEIDVKLKNEFSPFLASVQNVDYKDAPKAVSKAKELTKGVQSDIEQIRLVYGYIVNHIIYDNDKAKQVIDGKLNGYVPDVDAILAQRKGICFDYSSLMGAMLRSLNIPTKLVMGYVKPDGAYHAWNEVYTQENGWIKINSLIECKDKSWSRMDSTFAASNKSGKQTAFLSDDKNYSMKFEY
jgi:transglutaminase-like putative cysteine protease